MNKMGQNYRDKKTKKYEIERKNERLNTGKVRESYRNLSCSCVLNTSSHKMSIRVEK